MPCTAGQTATAAVREPAREGKLACCHARDGLFACGRRADGAKGGTMPPAWRIS